MAQFSRLFFQAAHYRFSADECLMEKKVIAAICQTVTAVVRIGWPASIVAIAIQSPPKHASAIGATKAGLRFAAKMMNPMPMTANTKALRKSPISNVPRMVVVTAAPASSA